MSWIITLEEDPENGDLILPLPDDFMKSAGWDIGDTIEWIDNKDGTWTMRKTDGSSTSSLSDTEEAVLELLKQVEKLKTENADLRQQIKELQWSMIEHD